MLPDRRLERNNFLNIIKPPYEQVLVIKTQALKFSGNPTFLNSLYLIRNVFPIHRKILKLFSVYNLHIRLPFPFYIYQKNNFFEVLYANLFLNYLNNNKSRAEFFSMLICVTYLEFWFGNKEESALEN